MRKDDFGGCLFQCMFLSSRDSTPIGAQEYARYQAPIWCWPLDLTHHLGACCPRAISLSRTSEFYPLGTLEWPPNEHCQKVIDKNCLLGSPHAFCLERQDDTRNRTVRKKWSDLQSISVSQALWPQATQPQRFCFLIHQDDHTYPPFIKLFLSLKWIEGCKSRTLKLHTNKAHFYY